MNLMFLVLLAGLVTVCDSLSASKDSADATSRLYLASISTHGNTGPKEIVWGQSQDGIAVGVARLRTSLESPVWPLLDAYLKNTGSDARHVIQYPSSFRLELDGRRYCGTGDGGKDSPLIPGKDLGPIAIDTMWFHRVDDLVPCQAVEDSTAAPALSAGEHTLRIYFNWDGRFILSASVAFAVNLRPYPLNAGVVQITSSLRDPDSYVRSNAASVAARLGLAGACGSVSDALKDGNPGVRNSAARALGFIGDKSTVAALKLALSDIDMDVRVSAIESLVKLGQPFEIAWAEPVIRSRKSNAFDNAIWLVRRYGGPSAVAALIKCLDMSDPSVNSYYNYTLSWQIGACGGPRLKYNLEFDGKGTVAQVEQNRKLLAVMQVWLREHGQPKK